MLYIQFIGRFSFGVQMCVFESKKFTVDVFVYILHLDSESKELKCYESSGSFKGRFREECKVV